MTRDGLMKHSRLQGTRQPLCYRVYNKLLNRHLYTGSSLLSSQSQIPLMDCASLAPKLLDRRPTALFSISMLIQTRIHCNDGCVVSVESAAHMSTSLHIDEW